VLRASSIIAVSVAGAMGLLVQPMMGKIMLPSLGGGSGIWTATSAFFQGVLLLGYAYAMALQSLKPATQRVVHLTVGLVGLVCFLLPTPAPDGGALAALLFLSREIGMAMIFVYSTSPLVQGWLSGQEKGNLGSIYRLFALSNLAAIAGLLSYPFLIERHMSVDQQSLLWGGIYAVLLASMLPLIFSPISRRPLAQMTAGWEWRWLLLPLLSTVLMLSLIARLTRDAPPTPFIWAIVLGLFLLTYTLAFSGVCVRVVRSGLMVLAPIACVALAMTLYDSTGKLTVTNASVIALSFFAICSFLHAELAAARPAAERLPSYYVAMAFGGFIGGMIMLAMPWALDTDIELFLVIPIVLGLGVGLLNVLMGMPRLGFGVALSIMAAGCFYAAWKGDQSASYPGSEVVHRGRTFFGTYRIESRGNYLSLVHNGTLHGAQSTVVGEQANPLTYYCKTGPLGNMWETAASSALTQSRPIRAATIGLGTGTIAAYAQNGDELDFYEIDPEIAEISPKYFSFFDDAKVRGANLSVKLGDGRKVLESSPPSNLDILVIDAFSGDSVPAHLVTVEAFQEYIRHLGPEGILAVHVSNRVLDVWRVALGAAQRLGLHAVQMKGGSPTASHWVAVSKSPEIIADLRSYGQAVSEDASGKEVVWTDKFSDFITVVK